MTNKTVFLAAALTCLLSIAFCGDPVSENAKTGIEQEEHPSPAFAAIGTWDSRFVTEGRDNLSGSGIYSFTLEAEYAGLILGAWLVHGPDADYQEQDYFALYSFELGPLEAYVSYTHLQFMSDDDKDNEFGVGIALPDAFLGWSAGLDAYYSDANEGYFAEASIAREFILGESLVVIPSFIFGYNDGYIPDGHNGANHLISEIIAAYPVSENCAIEAYAAYNFAINSDPTLYAGDASLSDFFFYGVGIAVTF